MRDKFFKLLVYSILISQVKAQFGALGALAQFGNLPILSQLFAASCTITGRPNEVYSACGNNACQNTCRNPTVTNGCSGACVAGCICASGYLRNSNNICVLQQNCDVGPTTTQTCTGANQVFSACGNDGCRPTCSNQNVFGCVPICSTPSCICAPGFVRSAEGNCIAPSSCPLTTCSRANEVFSQCGNDGCQLTCSRRDVSSCIRICSTPGCICATSFVRDDAGNCISPSSCPVTSNTCSGANEVFSTCGNDGCQRSCDRLIINNCVPTCSTPGCICAFGFVRNSMGVCVFPTSCPFLSCNGPNEVFSLCGNDGCQRSCARMDVSTCIPSCSIPGCICGPGFVRNNLGICVVPTSCPSTTITCTRANEVLSACGNDGCQRSCTRLDVTGCTPRCNSPGCICVSGFIRNANGDCVLPGTCPTVSCSGVNEVFSACGNDGCQRTCSRLETTGCRPVCSVSGCVCISGYVRNANGNCVPSSACPTPACVGANEMFSTCGNDGCQRSCTRLDTTGCSPLCTLSGCVCVPGFVRNDAGICVLPATCPAVTCSGANEIFSACGNDGCQRSCTRLDVTGCNPVCSVSGCVCAVGFVRNAMNQCVATSTCPTVPCSGANEVFSACGEDGCQASCTRISTTGCQRVCTRSGCVCLPGYVRNSLGACIMPSSCPTVTCSGANEVLSPCGNDGCQRSCTRLDVTGCTGVCIATGCVCVDGFVRNADGICVLPSTCPRPTCSGANEMFSACGDDGCQRTCDRLDVTGCTRQCTVSGCICMPGFVRNNLGVCVLPFMCPIPMCPNANEIFSTCGNDGCQRSCTRLDVTGCVPICSRSGCICAAGYVKNAMGLCVQANDCPILTCPGANEIFSACGDDGCQRRCNRLDVTGCNRVCTTSGCICRVGFVRNALGACVEPTNCPTLSCSGSNEILSTCGNDGCQRSCLRLDTTGCIPVCGPSACICAPGFVRDATNACVLPGSCPPVTCPANEILSACGDDGCQRSCSRLDTTGCNRVCSATACICSPGFVRNSARQCVLPSTCVPPTCSAPNEVFSECGNNGCQRSCTRQDVTGCTPVCSTSGCICATGFVRNSAGECVALSACPGISCTATNEVFSPCGEDGCQRSCTRLDVTGCTRVCVVSGCICAAGFVRNSAGACVASSTCPPVTCTGNNELFSPCGDDGCQKTCRRPDTTGCVPVCRLSGCICRQGFVRDDAGACVSPSACPVISCNTAANEILSSCGEDGCQASCMRLQTTGCTRVCNMAGCICRPGTVRNSMGVCILTSACPITLCTGANEIFSQCGDDGCQRSCTRRETTGCNPVCRASGCICSANFVRNLAGQCVSLMECPTVTCPNFETFSNCGEHNCIESCSFIPTLPCRKVCVDSGCVCNTGRFRNADRLCVPQRECSPTCGMNQFFSSCGNDGCRPTCLVPNPLNCISLCTVPACICQRGFFLNTVTNACVAPCM